MSLIFDRGHGIPSLIEARMLPYLKHRARNMELGLIAKATDEVTLSHQLDANETTAFLRCSEAMRALC